MGNRVIPAGLDRLGLGALIAAATICGGCTAVTLGGKAVGTTVGVAADVTAATVRGTGTVAAAAVGATSKHSDESLRTASRLSKAGSVVFFDPRTGAVCETPWKQGLKLLGAAGSAKVGTAFFAVRVIRAGQAIDTTGHVATFVVKPGDVVELARRN